MGVASIDRVCVLAVFMDEVVTALQTVVPQAAESFHVGHAKMFVLLRERLAAGQTPYVIYDYWRSGSRHVVRYWNGDVIETAIVQEW